MKILTKLMLASAVMVTSGFAVDPDPVIDGTIKIESGAEWETTKDHTITSTGAVTLEKTDTEGNESRWTISEGNTIDVQGGSVTVVNDGEYEPIINLDGTIKLNKEESKIPTFKLSDNTTIEGVKVIDGVYEYETHYESYPPSENSTKVEIKKEDIEPLLEEERYEGKVITLAYLPCEFPYFFEMTGLELGGIAAEGGSQYGGSTIGGDGVWHVYPIVAKFSVTSFTEGWEFTLPTIVAGDVTCKSNGSIYQDDITGQVWAPYILSDYNDQLIVDVSEGTLNAHFSTISTYPFAFSLNGNSMRIGYGVIADGRKWNSSGGQCDFYVYMKEFTYDTATDDTTQQLVYGNMDGNGTVDSNSNKYYADAVRLDVNRKTVTLGKIDMQALREYKEGDLEVLSMSDYINGINPTRLAEVKLPFNCDFTNGTESGMNLENVDKVTYTKVIAGKTYRPVIDDSEIVTEEVDGGTYGDYAENALGVRVDVNKCQVTEINLTGGKNEFDLKTVAEDLNFNKSGLTVVSQYLSDNTHAITADTTYNFGFSGSKAIKISGTDKVATFKGDASGYAPTGDITLTNKTVYAGNNSFIKVNHAYDELEFAAAATGQTLANEIPSGVEVSATKFSVGKGHTLTVKGKLRA